MYAHKSLVSLKDAFSLGDKIPACLSQEYVSTVNEIVINQ